MESNFPLVMLCFFGITVSLWALYLLLRSVFLDDYGRDVDDDV
jgi:hypothetical protein